MPPPDADALLPLAQDAVSKAVEYVLAHPFTDIREKGDRDIVTDTDEAVERLVLAMLAKNTPDIGFLGEETGATGNRTTYWVLDPIDGTVNFSHGLPLHAIALGLVHDEQPILGVIALPFLGPRYWATHGGGAYRDDVRLHVSGTTELSQALLALSDYGSGPGARVRDLLSFALDREFTTKAQGLRRLGSAAVDLAFVADGSVDASVTLGNRTWDTAAGAVIAREAGALVMDADGSPHTTRSRCAIAVTPGLRDSIVPILDLARDTPYWPGPTPPSNRPEEIRC
ncbi:inositol monophosphatase family protein [Amycolatopsis cihanbeyliensis]|uniref:Inositol-1-monophosphatase n=1 Tax=Amycolatopsis cihanbeyliensis TaxID=1128664 RepID=A0A542DPR1_AMYCI|nr:inositol monophosphatase family protein [Amycolatopsis cihanbeyliensis]TQJ05093.1 myo-inositol-1(or 4)-monophosphatase [Amycolatopsis cihanbeyliensis]